MTNDNAALSTLKAKRRFNPSKKTSYAALPLILALPLSATAQLYWGDATYTGTTSDASSWYTDATGSSVSATAPNGEDLIFNTTPGNLSGGDITVNADFSANSLTFNTSGNTRLVQSGTPTLTLGTGGITLGASSGTVTLGTGNFLNTKLTDSQQWINNSSSTLTVRSLSANTDAGAVTLTLNAAGTGHINFSQNISDNESDPLAVVVDTSGSGVVSMFGASNSIRGGTTIKRGTLQAYGGLGSGSVLLGDTTGSSNARLNVRHSSNFTNDITVQAGSSGTKTLNTNQTGGVTLGGALILNDDLSLLTSTNGTFNGPISGTGDIVKTGSADLIFAGANTSTGDLTIDVGAFTLASSGSLEFTIGANGVNNQVNGVSSDVTFDGTFIFDLTGAELIDGNTWTIVASNSAFYGVTFEIAGFVENSGIWTKDGFTFSESTSQLSYAVPEPSTAALILGSTALILVGKRRRPTRP